MPLEENTSWFVFTEGQQHGPVAAENLVAFLAAHTGPPVYVWRDGFADWMLASDVPELTASPQLAPPPQMLLLQPPVAAEAPAEAVAPGAAREPCLRRRRCRRASQRSPPAVGISWPGTGAATCRCGRRIGSSSGSETSCSRRSA